MNTHVLQVHLLGLDRGVVFQELYQCRRFKENETLPWISVYGR